MVDWQTKAREVFPEKTDVIAITENPYGFWIDLCDDFEQAYEEPQDEDLIRRIYGYADWCQQQERRPKAKDDLLTCVSVCFHEHIPTIPKAREDMPRWFTREEVEMMKDTFGYFLSGEEFDQLLALFPDPKAQRGKWKSAARKRSRGAA